MIRGIYTSASALRAATMHQSRLAHNLSNLETTGFKQILTTRQTYELQRVDEYGADLKNYLSNLGGMELGLLVPEEIIDLEQGSLEATERSWDFGIAGQGFFRVQTPGGERYTRDGSFHRDSLGQLVTADGHFVLNGEGQPIVLPDGEPVVTQEGLIYVGDVLVDQISLAAFDDQAELIRENDNLFRSDNPPNVLDPNGVVIRQGYLEASNVDENSQVLEMMRILRLYQASQRTLQVHDNALAELMAVGEI